MCRPCLSPQTTPQQSAIRYKLCHVIVQLSHRLVERGEPGPAGSGELGQVSVGYLTMTDDSLNGNVGVRKIVGPEFVPRVGGGPGEDRSRMPGDGHTVADRLADLESGLRWLFS